MEQKWTRKYQTIRSFSTKGTQITVTFANGDTVVVPCTQLIPRATTRVDWERASAAADGFSIAIPAEPHALEVSWSVIRNLTDEDFARHMAQVAAKQARYIGERIRELRERREWTQAKVASLTGIQQANISRIENGAFDISTSTLWKILGAMGYSARDLAA